MKLLVHLIILAIIFDLGNGGRGLRVKYYSNNVYSNPLNRQFIIPLERPIVNIDYT